MSPGAGLGSALLSRTLFFFLDPARALLGEAGIRNDVHLLPVLPGAAAAFIHCF